MLTQTLFVLNRKQCEPLRAYLLHICFVFFIYVLMIV